MSDAATSPPETEIVPTGAPGPGGEAPAEAPVPISELRVTIDFDLGRATVPLGVVAGWQPGAIVEIPAPPTGEGVPVTIRANGDVVGLGDLVRIDERVAVRLTRVSLRS